MYAVSLNNYSSSELISKRLDGKIAVITGGSSGIGLATAQRFVQEGAYTFIFGRGQSEIDAAVTQLVQFAYYEPHCISHFILSYQRFIDGQLRYIWKYTV